MSLWINLPAIALICLTLLVWFLGTWVVFAVQLRLHLGRLWSGNITRKEGHRVIDTGPYALVRHPIYTGLLLAIFATAAAKGTVLGVLAAVLFTVGLWRVYDQAFVYEGKETIEDRRWPYLCI